MRLSSKPTPNITFLQARSLLRNDGLIINQEIFIRMSRVGYVSVVIRTCENSVVWLQ